jgi:uncharacterized beta-barrel protein YwiB (DUF1934 family)
MKHPVAVQLSSCQLDADGHEQRTHNQYQGVWYQQGRSDYLVYHEDGIQTTLRWDEREWRLFRRGTDLEGWQVFRLGESLESDLRLSGSLLPLETHTHRLSDIPTQSGRELQLEYTLYSGPDLLGNFTLVITLTKLEEDPARGQSDR